MLTRRAFRSSTSRSNGGESGGRRTRTAIAVGLTLGLVAAGVGGGAATALPTDLAEAEGLLLSGGVLDAVATLEGAYTSFPPADEVNAPIAVSALDAIDVGLGVQLFGPESAVTLGGVGQYSRSNSSGAYAASGLITSTGGIQAGSDSPGENTTLELAPVLDDVEVQGLLSDLSLELGAVAATATATRDATGATSTGVYQIAAGDLTFTSPVLAETLATLDGELADASATLTALADTDGAIDTTVGGLLGGLDGILEELLLEDIDLDDPTVTSDVTVDLGTALDTVADEAFVSGPVTLTLSTGEVIIDLDELYALNDLDPNTVLLSDGALNPTIAEALSDILTTQLPAALDEAIENVLTSTAVEIAVSSGVSSPGEGDLGTLDVVIDTTLGGLLGLAGSTAPTVTVADTEIVGLDLDEFLASATTDAVDNILPAVGDVVAAAFDLGALEADLTDAATGTITALTPVFDAINTVVSITVNVQERPGDFRDGLGTDAGSFTQRAATILVAPDLLGSTIELNLASATVRAVALAAPVGLSLDPPRGPVTGGTDVTITGTDLADTTGVTFGTVAAEFTVNADGTISAIAPAQAEPGSVAVTLTNVDGSDSSLAFEYLPVVAPAIAGLSPEQGPESGGTVVTIIGEDFTGTSSVTFDGVPATEFTVISDTEIEAMAPPHAPGLVDLIVTNGIGDSLGFAFRYLDLPDPVIDTLTPTTGATSGGTVVTVTGSNLDGVTSVTFDGVPGRDLVIVSDTELRVTTPANAPGDAVVLVVSPAGTSDAGMFRYVAPAAADTGDGSNATGGRGGALPSTGGDTGAVASLVGFGMLLLLGGAATLLLRRRLV
ncbi:choice-of-anchor G family protein [Microbacterium sp. P04]|uniref:choice-of-anchor G family protein n=1 Tax=Microbacterium sp. P04 TaxID=3366947 RepID=UPI003744DD28